MKAPPFFLSLSLLVILAGCAVPEPPPPEEALAEALPETTEVRESFAAADPTLAGPLPSDWIANFQDPELQVIVDEALQNNLNLQAAASQVEAAAGLVTQAGAGLLPVVSAAGSSVEQGFEGGVQTNTSQGALNVSWELDIWGKVRAQKAASVAQFEAVTADYEFARLSLKGQIARAWFTAVELEKQLSYAKEVVALNRRTLELVEIKFDYGDVDMQDVHLSRADLATAEERLRQVEGARKSAIRGLEVLLGRYPSAELEVATEFVAVPPPIPPGLPSELLERRPDLVAAERRVAAAFNSTTSAKAARLPSIGLTGALGGTGDELSALLGGGTNFWSAGLNFLGPIFQGGALKAQVEIATAEQEAALASYGQQALTAFSEVENALDNEGLLWQREELLQMVVEDNRQALELAQLQYQNGAIELLNLLQLQNRLINAQISLINMRNARLTERINLHLALGGDF
jgi:NodT family efflux transporter outer membrane factor (OMF) lipoprotein